MNRFYFKLSDCVPKEKKPYTRFGFPVVLLLLFAVQVSFADNKSDFAEDCTIPTTGFFEDFNDVAPGANSIPDCWNFIKTGSGIGQVTWQYEYFIYNMSDATEDYILVSPETVNLGNGTMRVRFSARHGNTPVTNTTVLEFGTLSDNTDPDTFTLIQSITLTSNAYTIYTVDLPAGTDDYFGFRHGQNAALRSIYLDNIYYEAIPTCPEVSSITMSASNPTVNSIDLSWENIGASFDIEYGPKGFTPTGNPNNTDVTEVPNPFTLTGLNHSTSYDYYVRQNCGGGDTSLWAGPYTFTTACDVYTSDFSEDFDTTGVGNSTNPSTPNCWNFIHGGYPNAHGYTMAGTGSQPTHSGANHFNIFNSLDTTNHYILVSPETDNLGNGTVRITFFARSNISGTTLQFGTLSDNTNGNTFTALQTFTLSNAYTEYIVDIPAGTDDYFGFRHGGNYSSRNVYIDTITYEQQPSCPDVQSYTMKAENITHNSAELSWESAGTTFDIEYGLSGFTPTETPNDASVTGVSNPFTLTGLNPDTAYDYYVRRDCGSEQSIWSGPYTFMTDCEIYDTSGFSEGFEVGSIVNPNIPNCWNFIKGGSAGSGTITTGTTSIPAHSGTKHFRITNGGSSAVADYILVSPETQDLGNGTMRVSFYARSNSPGVSLIVGTMSDNTDETTFTEVENLTLIPTYIRYTVEFPAGTDDYFGFKHGLGGTYRDIYIDTIEYEETPACREVHLLTMNASNITENSAELSWGILGVGIFDIEYGEAGFTPTGNPNDASVTGITSPFTLTGLDPNTAYDYYVRRNCLVAGTSTWTGPYTFKTGCAVFTTAFSEDFDTTPVGSNENTTVPDCWSFIKEGGGFGFVTAATAPNTPPRHFTLGRGYPTDGNEFVLVSPRIDGLSNGTMRVRFYAKKGGSYSFYPVTLHIGTLGDNTDESTFTELETVILTTGYTEYKVSFPIGTDEYFAFRISGDAYPTVFLDNIVYEEQPVVWTTDNEWLNNIEPTIEKEVIVQGDLFVGTDYGDFEAKILTLEATGSLIIEGGSSVTVNSQIINNATATDFVIESSANLIQIDDVANTGEITVRRNSTPMYRLDTTLWSSPVEEQNLFGFSEGTLHNRFYYYDAVNNIFDNVGLNEDSVFEAATGYGIRSPNTYPASDSGNPAIEFEGEFIGIPHNGTYTVATELMTDQTYGYNLVGNPYPSALDATMFTAANNDVGVLYFWTHLSRPLADGTYPKGNYATWTPENGGVAAAADEDENFKPEDDLQIQPGQGFFVRTVAAGNVTFNNTMRTNGTGQFYFTEPERHRFWLNLESEQHAHNQILIGYVENATLGFDHRIDANIMNYNGNALSSIIEDASTSSATQRLVIQGRPLPFDDTDVVPLSFKAVHSGHFTISIEKLDGLFEEGQKIYIKDGRYGILHDLTESGYTFYSPPGEHNERFEIVYATEGEMGIEDIIYNNILIYGYDFMVYIHSQVENITKVEIYDLLGRKLYQRRLSGAETEAHSIEIPTEAFGNQLLLVRAYTQDGKTVVKRVLNR